MIKVNGEYLRKSFLELVNIPSPSGEEGKIQAYLKNELGKSGVHFEEDRAGAEHNYPFNNILVRFRGRGKEGLKLGFFSHLDTVRPVRQGAVKVEGDLVRTDGTSVLGGDDKSGVAVMLELIRIFVEGYEAPCDVTFVFTVGEEVGLIGSKGLDASKFIGYSGVVLDCSRPVGQFVAAGPGFESAVARFIGRASHAGTKPEEGIHAHQIAAHALSSLLIGRLDEESTRNFIFATCAAETNVIPETVELKGEIRSLDSFKIDGLTEETFQLFNRTAEEHGGKLEWRSHRSFQPFRLDENLPVMRLCAEAYRKEGIEPEPCAHTGGSDANHLNEKGIPSVNLGMATTNCHSTREQYDMKNLEIIARIALNIIDSAADYS